MTILVLALLLVLIGLTLYIKLLKDIIESYEEAEQKNFKILKSELKAKLERIEQERDKAEKEKQEFNKTLDDLVAFQERIVQDKVAHMKEVATFNMEKELAEIRKSKLESMDKEHKEVLAKLIQEELDLDRLIAPLRNELNEYKIKRDAVNAALQRENEMKMQKDFHKIILSEINKEDVSYLLSIEQKIHNKEILRKLIFETYVRPEMVAMQKRVLDAKDFSGIYKITDSQGRAYIGKSTSIKSRWQSHCKEALGIGGISHQLIHNAIKERGWDDFSWEVLEKCEKDVLGEREKFYISFYETNVYGYNTKAGG